MKTGTGPGGDPAAAIYFESAAAWRRWLAAHHASATALWVGFHKKGTGAPTMTWPESVDEALCHGWIDGIRKSVDDHRYVIRFTPRKPTSIWSAVNTRRAQELIDAKRMRPPGLRAFEARVERRSGVYSFEQRRVDLPPEYAKRLRANTAARKFFESEAPSYRKACFWWIVSAKREETRGSRLERLIEHSAKGERIPQFVAPPGKGGPKRSRAARPSPAPASPRGTPARRAPRRPRPSGRA